MTVDTESVPVSPAFGSAPPAAAARPTEPPVSDPPESPEDVVARLERWVEAMASDTVVRTQAAAPSAPRPVPAPAAAPPVQRSTPRVRDDLIPPGPSWLLVPSGSIARVGVALVSCLATVFAFVALGARVASVSVAGVGVAALVAAHDRARVPVVIRVIVGIALGIALVALS